MIPIRKFHLNAVHKGAIIIKDNATFIIFVVVGHSNSPGIFFCFGIIYFQPVELTINRWVSINSAWSICSCGALHTFQLQVKTIKLRIIF